MADDIIDSLWIDYSEYGDGPSYGRRDDDHWPSALGMPLYAFERDVPLYELLLDNEGRRDTGDDYFDQDPRG